MRHVRGSVFGFGGDPARGAQLVCCPHAGGSAAAFRTWEAELPDGVALLALTLPGRGIRLREQLLSDMPSIVAAVVADLDGLLDDGCVLFGHSMGALVAYEVARALRDAGGPRPGLLGVSACPAPHLPIPGAGDDYSDAGILARLDTLGATPDDLRLRPELRAATLPAVRADFVAGDTYRHVDGPPLDTPVTAWAGADDPLVAPGDVAAWRRHTTGAFTPHTVPAGHFYLAEQAGPIVRELVAAVRGPAVPTDPH